MICHSSRLIHARQQNHTIRRDAFITMIKTDADLSVRIHQNSVNMVKKIAMLRISAPRPTTVLKNSIIQRSIRPNTVKRFTSIRELLNQKISLTVLMLLKLIQKRKTRTKVSQKFVYKSDVIVLSWQTNLMFNVDMPRNLLRL